MTRHRYLSLIYGTPFYGWTLLGRSPDGLTLEPMNVWRGDARRGSAMLRGEFSFAGETVAIEGVPWTMRRPGEAWRAALHGFGWLADLHAVGSDAARRRARELADDWIGRFRRWDELAWRPDVMGARIAAWISEHDFFCATAEDGFRRRFYESLARQTRHLARAVRLGAVAEDGVPRLVALKGLVYAAAALPGGERRLAAALDALAAEVQRQVLPDGGHFQRDPARHLGVLQDLIDIRAILIAGQHEVPSAVLGAIDRMAPMLRFFRHGDGGLALFNDGGEEEEWRIDAVLNRSEATGKAPASAPHSGFQRLAAGRTVVIADVGPPPPPGADRAAHAGTLSFEMSVGKERMIVNCGAHRGPSAEWRAAQRTTAAHSTLVLADRNSSEILPSGHLGRRPATVECRREDADGAVLVDASHDGYRENLGTLHRRRLYLSAGGDDLRGEDTLVGEASHPFAVRFHLHPSVKVSLLHDGTSALLRLPNGAGWRFHANGGAIALEESIYMGTPGEARRTEQLVIRGTMAPGTTTVKWAIQKLAETD